MFSILSLIFGINNSNNVYVQNNDFNVNTGFTKYVKKEAYSFSGQIGSYLVLNLQMASTRNWTFKLETYV